MDPLSERLTIQEYNGKKIIFVDYTGLKETGMIELVTQHQVLTLKTGLPFVADFRNTFATPGYMLHGKQFVSATKHIIDKGAFLGIDPIKSMILKGILFTYDVNYKAFENKEQAIAFLTEGSLK